MIRDWETDLKLAVASLPDTADGIARLCESEGIKGYPISSRLCPLAVVLNKKLGLVYSVHRGSASCSIGLGVRIRGVEDYASCKLTAAAKEFVLSFDRRKYPSVIEEGV